jgi:hypothetical protein
MFVVAVPLWTLFQMVSMVVSTMGGSDLDQRIAVMLKILTDYLQIGKHTTKLLVYNTQTTHNRDCRRIRSIRRYHSQVLGCIR